SKAAERGPVLRRLRLRGRSPQGPPSLESPPPAPRRTVARFRTNDDTKPFHSPPISITRKIRYSITDFLQPPTLAREAVRTVSS
ncbi:unnamed protein product, partial [Ixodes persulcatus]